MISLDLLEKVEVFTDLNDDQLTVVQGHCRELEFQRGDQIFATGQEPKYLWAVMNGKVELRWELPGRSALAEQAITTLPKFSTFGWSSLVPPYKYRLSAYCATRNCKVMQIERNGLIKLFQKDTVIGYKVMTQLLSVVGARFLNLQDEIAKRRGHDIMNRW